MFPSYHTSTKDALGQPALASTMFDPSLASTALRVSPRGAQPRPKSSAAARRHRRVGVARDVSTVSTVRPHTSMSRASQRIDDRVHLWSPRQSTEDGPVGRRATAPTTHMTMTGLIGNDFPSSPFLRRPRHGRPASFRKLRLGGTDTTSRSRAGLPPNLSPSPFPPTSNPTTTTTTSAALLTPTHSRASSPPHHTACNEHDLASLFRGVNRECQIRFLNFVMDEICGENPNVSVPVTDMLDDATTFRRCDEGLLEGLEGSSDRNIFRRRALVWMLMRMSRKRGEGGCWEQWPLDNVRQRRHIERLEQELERRGDQHRAQALRHKRDQDQALESTTRVLGRLKKRLGDTELVLLETQAQNKLLEKKAATLNASNQQHKAAVSAAQDALRGCQVELADKRKEGDSQRVKILALEQQIRTLRKAPPLWQVLQKAKSADM